MNPGSSDFSFHSDRLYNLRRKFLPASSQSNRKPDCPDYRNSFVRNPLKIPSRYYNQTVRYTNSEVHSSWHHKPLCLVTDVLLLFHNDWYNQLQWVLSRPIQEDNRHD